jgi:hypothetical protein
MAVKKTLTYSWVVWTEESLAASSWRRKQTRMLIWFDAAGLIEVASLAIASGRGVFRIVILLCTTPDAHFDFSRELAVRRI